MGLAAALQPAHSQVITPDSISPQFTIVTHHDSLSFLILREGATCDKWRLPYPVYRFETGDVDGDGKEDAMVGVIKRTRFYPQKARRLFIFKNWHGRVRALWLGSKLGGILQDFRFIDGKIRSLETTTDHRWVVAEYRWQGFGMGFERFLINDVDEDRARDCFLNFSDKMLEK